MSGARRQGLTAEATIFVAFMLLIQAFFSGLALGAEASPLQLDAFGQVICTTDGGKVSDQSPTGSEHSHHLDCCTLGCSMVGAAVPSLPSDRFSPPNRTVAAAATLSPIERPLGRVELSPQNPRAPPGLN